MGDVLAKESDQSKQPLEDDTWEYREDADGASSVEDSILRDIQEKLKLTRVSDDNYEDWDSITECCCDACQEPIMSIRNPHFDRVQEHWQKLRRFIQIVYKLAVVRKPLPTNYHNQIQCIIHELVTLEPHLLYKQLEAQIQEWVIETELRHLERLLVADKVKDIPHMFISGLLESYRNLMAGAELAFPVLEELEKVHLSKFNMTWSLLNEHIYQSSVYADPLVQNNVPLFIEKLGSTKESMKSNADLVKEFLCLDDSINSVAELWIDCERRLEKYAEEQEEIEGRRALLELEWKNFKEGGKTSLINKTLKTIVTRKKCIPDKNGACKQCGNQVNTNSNDCCSISHEEIVDSNVPLNESRFTSSSLLNGNLPSPEQFVNTIEAVHKDAKLKNSSISSVIESMLASDCMTFECSPSSSSRPPTPPPQPFSATSTSHSSHAHPHSHNHTQQQQQHHHHQQQQQQPAPPHSQSNGKTNISTQQQIYNKARELVIKKRRKPQACQKIRKTCSHHNHPHSLKHGEPVKRVSSCEQHRLQEAEESDGTSPPDDSCSDKSSTSTQKGNGDPRHCDCCYCEVFGHGGPSGAPVSRNYQEIRERLRLLLNKKKNSNNNPNSNKKASTDATSASTAHNGNSNVKSGGPPSDLLNKLPAPKQQQQQQQPQQKQQPQYKGDQCINDILDYIEGNSKIKDMKKAAKKARQKEKKLQEMYLKKLEEEAIERAKLDAEKKRRVELLREKERLIKEQQRLEGELQKQNQKLSNNRKALSVKNNNEKNIKNSNNESKKNNSKKKKGQQNNSQSGQTAMESTAITKKKQKSKTQVGEESADKVNHKINGDDQEEAAPKMVTIKRVMENVGTEPTVTITLRGATPNEDKILYTLQNGHVCPIQEKNKLAAANNANAALNSATSKKSKKQQKKLNQQAALLQQQQHQSESQPRATMATHVQHSPGVVEINVNGGPIKPLTGGIKFDPKSVQINNKKSKLGGTELPTGFSSMSVINVKPPSNGIIRKPVSTPAPAPELTTPSAIQISNAISSFTAQHEINFEDLRLPPGITITKVEAPLTSYEERSSPSTSCDGGDVDPTNKENASSQPSVSKKSKKKKNKQNQQQQQHIASSEFIPNHTSSALTTAKQLQNDGKAIIKVKGSMVTIRNPAVFSNDTDAPSQYTVKQGTGGKKGKKDGRPDEWNLVDEESVFAPKDIDLENGDIDDAERELEAFKRFCSQSVPPKAKEKVKVNLNIKDIVLKKKRAAISCS